MEKPSTLLCGLPRCFHVWRLGGFSVSLAIITEVRTGTASSHGTESLSREYHHSGEEGRDPGVTVALGDSLLYFQRLHPHSACGSWQCPPLPWECPALLPWGGYHFILREHGSCPKTWELLKFTASTGGRHVAMMGPQAQVSAHMGKPSARSAEDHPALSSFPGISRWSTISCSQVTTPSMLFDFFNLFIFNWRIIALQYCVGFCHISAWSSHRYKYVPCLLSSPPPHSTPLGGNTGFVQIPTNYLFYIC